MGRNVLGRCKQRDCEPVDEVLTSGLLTRKALEARISNGVISPRSNDDDIQKVSK